MGDEESTIVIIDQDEDDEEECSPQERIARRYKKLQKKHKGAVDDFMGSDARVTSVVILP